MELQNNTIYQYQGGGYDGCFWEWNFFFIDKTGNFHDIFSSGRDGITDIESAKEKVFRGGTFYTYCIDSEKDLDELVNETHGHLVSGLVKWFEEKQNNEVYMICSECETKLYNLDEVVVDEDVLCYDCHGLGSCSVCGDYAGPENIYYSIDLKNPPDCLSEFTDEAIAELSNDMENLDRCEFCLQNAAQGIENNGTKESLFLALLTGKGLFTTVRIG